jgi:hypothetical protein
VILLAVFTPGNAGVPTSIPPHPATHSGPPTVVIRLYGKSEQFNSL